MKNNLTLVARKIESSLNSPALQARRSPALQLISARNTRRIRITVPATSRGLTIADRKLTAARYAAELSVWQATGGDVLLSKS